VSFRPTCGQAIAAVGVVSPLPFAQLTSRIVHLAALLAALALAAPSDDERFVESLRALRLYRLAETHCEQALAHQNIPPDRQGVLVVEWSRTLAAAARDAVPAEAEPLWQRARLVIAQFSERNPQHPRLPLVDAQGALVELDRAMWLADDAELLAPTNERVVTARGGLAAAARKLRESQERVEQSGRRKGPATEHRAALKPFELQNLAKRLRFEQARAYLRLAEISAADSPDRADGFAQASKLLEPLAELPTDHPLAWSARVAQIACLRGTGDRAGAERLLAAAEKSTPPQPVARELVAERARLLALAGRIDDALFLLNAGDQSAASDDPQADELRLELAVSAWRAAQANPDKQGLQTWQVRITQLTAAIEAKHGPYWSRRADRLLAELGSVAATAGPVDAALLARTAANHWRDGQPAEALTVYDRAAGAAATKSPEQAFDLGFLAATIEHSQQHWDAAASRYQKLAEQWPANARAPEAHLLAAHDRLQAIETASPGDAAALGPYIELLTAHLQRWPESNRTADVRWRLGRAFESQHKLREAVDQYRAVPIASERALDAIEATSRTYARLAADAAADTAIDATAARRLAQEAGEFFDSLSQAIVAKPAKNAERQQELVRAAALAAAKSWISCPPEGYRRAWQILTPLVAEPTLAAASWQPTAQALLVAALVGDGRLDQARQHLDGFVGLTPATAQSLLTALSRAFDRAPAAAERQRQMAELKLLVFDKLGRSIEGASPAERRELELLEAQSLAEAGRADEAAARFKSLRESYPRDAGVLEAQAASLSLAPGVGAVPPALAAWRDVERHVESGSPRWLRAKLELARLHLRGGDRAQAAKIVEVTTLLHPELGGPELKSQFEALQRDIGATERRAD